MDMVMKIKLIIISILLLTASSLNAAGANNETILPEKLSLIAKKHNCVEVKDFYINRPGIVNHSYVFGYLPGNKELSAVFWCQKKISYEIQYYLYYYSEIDSPDGYNCPALITTQRNLGGLYIKQGDEELIFDYSYVNGSSKDIPIPAMRVNNAIVSEYDGAGRIFYCYKGEWITDYWH